MATDHIRDTFKAMGYEIQQQPHQVEAVDCVNLMAEIAGRESPQEIVILGAHYESIIGTPGANNTASGVAAMLLLAERFTGRPALPQPLGTAAQGAGSHSGPSDS